MTLNWQILTSLYFSKVYPLYYFVCHFLMKKINIIGYIGLWLKNFHYNLKKTFFKMSKARNELVKQRCLFYILLSYQTCVILFCFHKELFLYDFWSVFQVCHLFWKQIVFCVYIKKIIFYIFLIVFLKTRSAKKIHRKNDFEWGEESITIYLLLGTN